jgi:hypothetical protein
MSVITKITRVEPKMKDGHQRSSSGQYGTSFYYYIEFENGWKGEVGSKSVGTYPIEIGVDVEVSVKREGDGSKLPTYNVQRAKGGGGTGGGSGWDDSVQTLRVAMGICQECIVKTYEIMAKDPEGWKELVDGAQFYFSWITDGGKVKDRGELTRRWYALRNAVNSMANFTSDKFLPNVHMNSTAGFTSDNILLMAQRWLDQMEKITE